MDLRGTLRANEGRLWLFALLAAVVVVGVGLQVAPEVFWDRFVWEDIWGPTLTDAKGVPALCWEDGAIREPRVVRVDGVPQYGCGPGGTLAHSGYTLTSEIVYGLVLAAILYGIYRHVLQRYGVDTGGGFIVALLPLILLGPFARVMEDASVFHKPDGEPGAFAPLFISPWIYFQIAVYALLFLAFAILLDRMQADARTRRALVAGVLACETALYAFFTIAFRAEFTVVAPVWSFALAAVAAFVLYVAAVEKLDAMKRFHGTVAVLGIPLLAPSVHLMVRWVIGPQWAPHDRGLAPLAGAIMLGLALGAVFLVWWIARLLGTTRPYALLFAGGTSVALVLGHMIDGFATWIALKDPFDLGLGQYVEKHPVSDLLLRQFPGTPFEGLLYPLAKLAMVLAVIHLLQKEFGTRPAGDPEGTLGGLVRMAVFVLGFAPGTRNLLLVVMGF